MHQKSNSLLFESINHIIEALLFSFGVSVFIQIILYFLNQPFTLISFFVPFILYPLYRFLFSRKIKLNLNIIIAYSIIALLSVVLIQYFNTFIEHSFDGNMYHGEAMIQMLNGWNPVYNTNAYAQSIGYEWAVLYPKFTWIYSAFWIQLTGNSSAGMLLNALIAIITTLKVFLFTHKKTQSKWIAILVSMVVLFNPIFIEQIHTFYVDALMGNLLLLLIIYNLELAEDFSYNRLFYISLISILMINIKFTGFAFAGLIDLASFLYLLIKQKSNAFKYFIAGIFIIVLGVGVIGYSPYLVNLLNRRHIFFPLMGENKWDIVSFMIPEPMLPLRSYERFLYSLSMGKPYLENLLKIEEHGYLYYDQRIGGFGSQFFKLLILSTITIGSALILHIKRIKLYEAFMFVLYGVTILANFRNIWWARYAPQLWFVIPLSLIILFKSKRVKLLSYTLSFFMIFLVIYQTQDIYKHTFERDRFVTQEALDVYSTLRQRNDLVFFVEGGVLNQFSVFEEFKSREYGLDIKSVLYEIPSEPYECYRLDNYKICVVIENELE